MCIDSFVYAFLSLSLLETITYLLRDCYINWENGNSLEENAIVWDTSAYLYVMQPVLCSC